MNFSYCVVLFFVIYIDLYVHFYIPCP